MQLAGGDMTSFPMTLPKLLILNTLLALGCSNRKRLKWWDCNLWPLLTINYNHGFRSDSKPFLSSGHQVSHHIDHTSSNNAENTKRSLLALTKRPHAENTKRSAKVCLQHVVQVPKTCSSLYWASPSNRSWQTKLEIIQNHIQPTVL